MAEQRTEFAYRNIQLFKSESLGSGSYGRVCKAKCDGLLCAAKIMHPTLFDLRDPGTASYLRKFQEECHLLSLAKHPNVVQYLATYYDPDHDTRLPVLLMELCDESLTAFLERSPGPLSYHVQLNICLDIALALVYLHSNGLIHRDLTGSNVLMIGTRAKITDFGMSKLATGNPRKTMALCPGNLLYMSPEALDEAKSYTAKLDIFSFGVIAIQILTRQFPNPTNRHRNVHASQNEEDEDDEVEENEGGEVRVLVPETERRQVHLQLIPDTHSLKPLAIQCLKKEGERPSALQLSERLSELKRAPQYIDSVHQAQTRSGNETGDENNNLRRQLQEKQKDIDAKERQLQENRRTLVTKQHAIETKERQLQQTQQQLRDSQQLVAQFQQSLQQQVNTQTATAVSVAPKDFSKIVWREGMKAPEGMTRGAAVVHGNTAYFTPFNSVKVYSYQNILGYEKWSKLPDNPNKAFCLAVIDGHLTSVGGKTVAWFSTYINTLLSLSEGDESKQWKEFFPRMPTPRCDTACITTEQALVVAGGRDDMADVEVMDIDTKQWTIVCPLPQKLRSLSGIACGDSLYLAGFILNGSFCLSSVFTCSLSDLWQPQKQFKQQSKSKVWKTLSSTPYTNSTLASFSGHLLAIAGTHLYKYDSDTDSWWHVISQMKNNHSECLAVTLPEDKLIVVGGHTNCVEYLEDQWISF